MLILVLRTVIDDVSCFMNDLNLLNLDCNHCVAILVIWIY